MCISSKICGSNILQTSEGSPYGYCPCGFDLNQIHLLSLRGLISPPPQPTILYICIAKGWVSLFYGLSLMITALANS